MPPKPPQPHITVHTGHTGYMMQREDPNDPSHPPPAHHQLHSSDFASWSRDELVDVIIAQGIELRGESTIQIEALRDLAAAIFTNMPEKPPMLSDQDYMDLQIYALLIQHIWIDKLQARTDRLQKLIYSEQTPVDNIFKICTPATYQNLSNNSETDASFGVEMYPEASMRAAESENSNVASTDHIVADIEAPGFIPVASSEDQKVRSIKNFLDSEWIPPDWEKAKTYQNFVQPRLGGSNGVPFECSTVTTGRQCCLGGWGEQCDVFSEGQISAFSAYGAGITNYFKFLKFLVWIFLILSLIALPVIIVNVYGPGNSSNGLSDLSVTTVGHLAYTEKHNSSEVRIPFCANYGGFNIDCSMTKTQVGSLYSWVDVLITIIILFGFFWLKVFENIEEKNLDKNTIYASMYTLVVKGFSPDTTADDLTQFFTEQWPTYPIAGIQIGYNNEEEIRQCMLRGELLQKKKHHLHGHRYDCSKIRLDNKDPKDVRRKIDKLRNELVKDLKQIDTQIMQIQSYLEKIATQPQKSLVAFVVFNDDIASNYILNKYYSVGFFRYHFGDHIFKLKGENLFIDSANEPSTILWENLMYNTRQRLTRRFVTFFLALLLISISAVVTFGANYFQLKYTPRDNDGNSVLCPSGFDSMSREEQREIALNDSKYSTCYCSQLDNIKQQTDSVCRDYFNHRVGSQLFSAFSSVIVVCINIVIDYAIRYLASYEKHHSEDTQASSIFRRVFFLKFVNTSCVFLINNNHRIVSDVFGIKTNGSIEFTSGWYSTIGCTIILVQIGDIVSNWMYKYYELWLWRSELNEAKKDPRKALTQDELNKLHQGPQFLLSYSYAQIMSTFFVCLTFSTGIPVLYWIAFVNFVGFYFVEKYLFCNLYRAPPRYSTTISKQATGLIPYALVLHLGMSMWVLSNKEFFGSKFVTGGSDTTIADGTGSYLNAGFIQNKIEKQHTFPLFVFFLVVIIVRLFLYFGGKILFGCSFICNNICQRECVVMSFFDTSDFFRTIDETKVCLLEYNEAVRRNRIKSLHTYNILQNPIYKELFGITWEFAINHHEVRDVRLDLAFASRDDEANDIEIADRAQRSTVNTSVISQSGTGGASLTSASSSSPQGGRRLGSSILGARSPSAKNTKSRLDRIRDLVRKKHSHGEAGNASTSDRALLERTNSNLRRQQILLGYDN